MPEEQMRLLRKILLTFLLAGTKLLSYGQADSVNIWIVVTNKIENANWYDKLMVVNKGQQIELIKQRLLADTVVLTTDSSSTSFYGQKFEFKYYCRPFIRVNGQNVMIDTPSQSKGFVALLDQKNFDTLEIVNPKEGKEKFGKWGLCGMLLLTTRDKKITERIKELGL
jgi:hypothetical protein